MNAYYLILSRRGITECKLHTVKLKQSGLVRSVSTRLLSLLVNQSNYLVSNNYTPLLENMGESLPPPFPPPYLKFTEFIFGSTFEETLINLVTRLQVR